MEDEDHLARMGEWGLSLIEATQEEERHQDGLAKSRIAEDVFADQLSKLLKSSTLDATRSGIVTQEGLERHAEEAEAARRKAAEVPPPRAQKPESEKAATAQDSMAKRIDLAVMRAAAASMRIRAARLLFSNVKSDSDKWVLHPDGRVCRLLELSRLVCSLYTIFAEPSMLSLSQTNLQWRKAAPGVFIFFSTFCDLFFAADLSLSPFKGYKWLDAAKGWQAELHLERSWRNYFYGWFSVDLLCIAPVQLLIWSTSHRIQGFDPLLLLSILKLTVFLRIWDYLSSRHTLKWFRVVNMIKGVLLWIASTHWAACFWLIYVFHHSSDVEDHVQSSGEECADRLALLGSMGPGSQYVCSIYWSFQSFLLTGYGDIVPNTRAERTFVICSLGLGCLLLFRAVVSVLHVRTKGKEEILYEEMSSVVRYLRRRKVLDHVIEPVYDFYQLRWELDGGLEDLEHIRQLPPQLRVRTFIHVHKGILESQHLLELKGPKDTRFWMQFIDAVEERTYLDGDVIARFDDPPERLYFLRHGTCHEIHPPYQDLLLREHRAPAWFGEVETLTGEARRAAVHAKSQCCVLEMSLDGIQSLSAHFPDVGAVLVRVCLGRLHRVGAMRWRALCTKHRGELHSRASLVPQPPAPWPRPAASPPRAAPEDVHEGYVPATGVADMASPRGEQGLASWGPAGSQGVAEAWQSMGAEEPGEEPMRAENEVGWAEAGGGGGGGEGGGGGHGAYGDGAGEEWREYSDDESGEHYFYNRETGETIWEWEYVERFLLPGQPRDEG